MEEPGGKRQKHEKEHAEEMDEEGIDDVRDSDEEGEEDVNEESEETKVITERLAHANMLIEEAELSEFQDKERVAKAGEIFQSVIEISKDQIEGGIHGKHEEVNSYLQTAMTINSHDERIEEVRQQINDMHSGKEKETVSVPKLIDCNTLSVRFVGVLQEVFKTFDKNNDGALSPDELDAFTRVVNGQPITKQTIRYMRDNLDWAPNNKGLTQEGFFQLYVSQTIGDPNETWEDLDKLGYNKDLEKK